MLILAAIVTPTPSAVAMLKFLGTTTAVYLLTLLLAVTRSFVLWTYRLKSKPIRQPPR